MLVLSLVGNSFVCYRLLTSRRQRLLKTQVLFLNLALADLLVTVVTINSQLLWEIMGRVWVAGEVLCRVFKVLQTYTLVSSTYMLVGIAVDRHFAICNPLKPAPKPRMVAATCWLLSLLPSVPNLFAFRLVVVRDKHYCASVFYVYRDYTAVRQVYMAFVFALVFVVPLVALVALYASVLLRLWRAAATATPESPRERSVVTNSPGRDRDRSTLPKVRVRTLKMAAVISLAFLVTNLPYMVQEMLLAFAPGVSLGPHAVAVFGVISASNSAINPYIYLAFNGGAGATVCEARMRGMWRRLTRSSASKRTTVSFRTQCSTLKTPDNKRLPAAAGLPLAHDHENCEMQEKASEKL
ncbi:gonadotropin-releasing hormone receptor-like [Dermacentor variabilis]|uniref:gonadotropin-releasing hormone receptor-like n=1 Tax=Dermacentor variabilis TaxID=34621 RepID=UPI003F5B8564